MVLGENREEKGVVLVLVVDKVTLLKIDKDCIMERDLLQEYLRQCLDVCTRHGLHVIRIRMCNSWRKGKHFYIDIKPVIAADKANRLQFLLGDDSQRYSLNGARIRSGLQGWNKLFEVPHVRLRTVYLCSCCISNRNDGSDSLEA